VIRGSKLKTLILAAGEGTRMRPLTANTPKPLLLVAGKPFLEHIIDSLKASNLKDIYILIGWRQERIKEYFGNGKKFGVKITYLEQSKRLGTAHAISIAEKHIKQSFLCINGDVVISPKYIKYILNSYNKFKNSIMTLGEVEDATGYGVVELKGNKVTRIVEKPKRPKSNLVNTGIYLFTPEIFDMIRETPLSSRGEYEITDSLQFFVNEKKLHGIVPPYSWVDVSLPWHLLEANSVLAEDIRKSTNKAKIEPNVTFNGTIRAGKGTVIRSGSYIEGSVIIGENCDIGPNCYIRGITTIGDNCKVGNAVEVKNSIIMHGTKIPHHNYVGDSILGENCNLGSGTKVANLKLNKGNISVVIKGETINTGLRKLGVIMGCDVQTGINSMLNVGTVIGEYSEIGPGAFASGYIAPHSKIF
jgi:bifunctional UDP-N-acetylglucosamine pyrophosphorylase/glucosamine-1-phosphate N-acetyltransferase